jgi:hypothetical protein
MPEMQERLIILESPPLERTLETIKTHYQIVQRLSNRMVIIALREEQSETPLSDIQGIRLVSSGEVPEEIWGTLDEDEALFVRGWSKRRLEKGAKERHGEGLNWDTPGHQPPK